MPILDDPMLALITRFVGSGVDVGHAQEVFAREQMAAIKRYVSAYPVHERNARALEWIERHAERYRAEWETRAAEPQPEDARCQDCPLRGGAQDTHCEIHDRWMELLERYLAREITSHRYVEDALAMLGAHKARLSRQ